ncbi:branched-chain amino acid ABC transporter permease [Streptomyces sp. PKU-MA01144]|uniref:branched-chain amino acid ABC transporter permease n=1 Tax=unclassified Streptomyces TaxID=2593676 RepID=UPI00039D5856|nr:MULTISPECIES: branched-chain amino acid ABC transporter permease [unclassified Streptomyces]MCZ7460977.1 branched-chain amino acid ABC transporter permease [Streptomyces sp. WMMC940]NNJ05236.1 branched-chain amino acid ABC transporter permease [Streptomyces sp. PKU-MA01144]
MSTSTTVKSPSTAAKLRRTAWYQQPRYTRLGALIALALVLTLMVGEQGNTRDLFYSVRTSLTGVNLWICLGGALVIWLVREFGSRQVSGAVGGIKSVHNLGPWKRAQEAFRTQPRVKWTVMIALLLAALFIPGQLTGYWQTVLIDQIATYALLAIGLNVVIGWAGLLDLGFVAFFAVGAYSAAFWTGSLPVEPPIVLNNFLIIPVAVVTCLIAGVLLGAPTLRLRGDYLAIVTLGFHEIVYLVAKNAEGVTGGPAGARQVPKFSAFGYEWGLEKMPYWYLLVTLIVVLIIVFARLEHSRVGRAWTAIREDEVAAAANGVDTVRFKLMAFAIGASTSGVAGVVYASKVGYFNPENFIILNSILVLSYVIFGGMGSIPGVLLGAAILVWLPEVLRDFVDPADRYMYLGALLVVMMIYRPQGVWPSRRRQRELKLTQEGIGDADAMTEPAGGAVR